MKSRFTHVFALVCAILLTFTKSYAQKYEFELFLLGSKIGNLTAEKKMKGDVEMLTITSSAHAKILWKEVNSQTVNRLVFKAGILTDAYYEYKENDVAEKFCKTSPAASGYNVHQWKKGKFSYPKSVTRAIASLYFKEPSNGDEYYDDNWGASIFIKKVADHHYEYKSEGGDKNVYKYSNGKISEAEFHTSIAVVKMRPKV